MSDFSPVYAGGDHADSISFIKPKHIFNRLLNVCGSNVDKWENVGFGDMILKNYRFQH